MAKYAKYIIEGGKRLSGDIDIHGAKNSVLPVLAASLLAGRCTLHNCPDLSDVAAACNILRHLGCTLERENDNISVSASDLTSCTIPESLMREMRSSVLFLGAVVARCGRAKVSMPGGCELGPRPIDLHLSSLEKLGVTIEEEYGYLNCIVRDRLRGATISLPFPSVGATENIMLAACTAEGETVIHNPAREPEIIDLVNFLQKAGAKINVGENGTIYIQGVKSLRPLEHTIIPDRIEAATYLCCAAITGGKVLLRGAAPGHLTAVFPVLDEAGCAIRAAGGTIELSAPERPRALRMVRTMPYPGFPTDAQSPMMALSCIADGTSLFVENIFENRYKHAGELARLGARINIEGRVAMVEGVKKLHGGGLVCTDLRGGAALCVAALAAQGLSEISQISHIERGYQDFDKNLRSLGAVIRKV